MLKKCIQLVLGFSHQYEFCLKIGIPENSNGLNYIIISFSWLENDHSPGRTSFLVKPRSDIGVYVSHYVAAITTIDPNPNVGVMEVPYPDSHHRLNSHHIVTWSIASPQDSKII